MGRMANLAMKPAKGGMPASSRLSLTRLAKLVPFQVRTGTPLHRASAVVVWPL